MTFKYALYVLLFSLPFQSSIDARRSQMIVKTDFSWENAGNVLCIAAGAIAGAFAIKGIFDYATDRKDKSFITDIDQHMDDYERTVGHAIATWPDMFQHQEMNALYGIEQLSCNAAYRVNNMVASLVRLDTYVLTTYDRERHQLGQLLSKWSGNQHYQAQAQLAGTLDYELSCLQQRAAQIFDVIAAHNEFVRNYRILRAALVDHAAQMCAWRNGRLTVNDACTGKTYPFISYTKRLQETYRLLTEQLAVPIVYSTAQNNKLIQYMHAYTRDIENFMFDIEVSRAYIKERADKEIAQRVREAEQRLQLQMQQLRPIIIAPDNHYHCRTETVVVNVQEEKPKKAAKAGCHKQAKTATTMDTEVIFERTTRSCGMFDN